MSLQQLVSIAFKKYRLKLPQRSKRVISFQRRSTNRFLGLSGFSFEIKLYQGIGFMKSKTYDCKCFGEMLK
mgnify:CR=1 FL=1